MYKVIILGDCLEKLKDLPDNSVDSIVTDPPAGIAFMGKEWDKDKGGRDGWIKWLCEVMTEAKRVLKPGGHALVWALPRTSHWTATAMEDAGFEIRDCVYHLFGSGFPKSLDISKAIDKKFGAIRETGPVDPSREGRLINQQSGYSTEAGWSAGNRTVTIDPPSTDQAKQWQGYGTALKPAAENWWLCRKPLSEKTVVDNVLKWGTGGINIDECRVEGKPRTTHADKNIDSAKNTIYGARAGGELTQPSARFPANLIHDGSEEVLAGFPESSPAGTQAKRKTANGQFGLGNDGGLNVWHNDSGSAARFFYCAKPSKAERNAGLEGMVNGHPTLKGQKLMQYLIKLITPPNGTVLDMFMGSGSTGVAAKTLGYNFIGIEKEPEYFEIAKARIEAAQPPNQTSLYDYE